MWLDRAVKWLLPREEHFYDMLERGSDCALRTSGLLVECCRAAKFSDRAALVAQMADIEHEADQVIHEVYESLNKTFVTPLDRSDIYALSTDLENITDAIQSTANQIVVHAMDDLPLGSLDLALKAQEACQELHTAVTLLRRLRELDQIRRHCKRVTAIESEGDRIFRDRIGVLFREEKDAIRLMKHKEFLEGLERTLDTCDDVANALETIVIKNG